MRAQEFEANFSAESVCCAWFAVSCLGVACGLSALSASAVLVLLVAHASDSAVVP